MTVLPVPASVQVVPVIISVKNVINAKSVGICLPVVPNVPMAIMAQIVHPVPVAPVLINALATVNVMMV